MARVRLDRRKIELVVAERYGKEAARRAAITLARRARGSVLGQGRIATHEMIRGFKQRDVTVDPLVQTWRVYNRVRHYRFQEFGTPRNAPGVGRIYPRTAKALRFIPKGGTTFVFAKSVRGVKPGEFMQHALKAARVEDFVRES